MNFKEILEEKLGAGEQRVTRPERGAGIADPAHLAFLLGTIPVHRFRTPPPRPASPRAKSPPTPPPRPRRPDHVLTERQKTATLWFAAQDEVLPSDFTADELKKAFRALARRLHPDTGGTAASFLELKAHHAALKAVPQAAT